jgi:glycosyltransferase involved in cell wall biosynthesis
VPILATNSPNKFFDALASGRAVIVNQPGWTRQLVEEHEVGIYIPVGDGRALAEAVVRLADDPGLRLRMSRNARALAEREFARDILAERLITVLEAVAARSERR